MGMQEQPVSRTNSVQNAVCVTASLQLVVHELDLGADDHLASVLAGADDTGSTSGLDSLLVHLGVILDLKAQTGCAVTNFLHVLLAADSSQNSGSDFGIVVVCQNDLLLGLFVLVLTAGVFRSNLVMAK